MEDIPQITRVLLPPGKNSWKMDLVEDQKLVDAIGQAIQLWYE